MHHAASRAAAPTGAPRVLGVRRIVFFGLCAATMLILLLMFVDCLAPGGFDGLDFVLTTLFALFLPWSVIGFWNAVIGLILMRFSADPVAEVMQEVSGLDSEAPISTSTALLMCIRNENAAPIFETLSLMLDGLLRIGDGDRFHLYVLSDTNDEDIAETESAAFEPLAARFGSRVTYRRRSSNEDFKAGNIRDFCMRWGARHHFMLTLDADSLMSPAAILRLTRLMQANPQLGILQSLAVGLPSQAPFARIFQFGMRLGMRSYTIGSAWWQGDCGPYWGHNAIIRIEPFIAHCRLEAIPGTGPLSGPILSHDQVEAVLMRKGGYDVRVLPVEGGSYEANPPALTEFIRRDLRWCQGNMQYLRLLGMPGVSAISKYQLCFAILMFVGSPASVIFTMLAGLRLALSDTPAALLDASGAVHILVLFLLMSFAPKFATLIDTLSRRDLRTSFGGTRHILLSVALETVFIVLVLPIMALSESIFLIQLALGKAVGWMTQQRLGQRLSWREAAARLWPHTLIGLTGALWFLNIGQAAFWWTLPLMLGPIVSIPLAVLTSDPALGRMMMQAGLCRLPEETSPPEEFKALGLV